MNCPPEYDARPNENLAWQIHVPVRLPTWNNILAMSLRERMRLKRLVKQIVTESICIADGTGSATPAACQTKRLLMQSLTQDYYAMIRRDTSRASRRAKRKYQQAKTRQP